LSNLNQFQYNVAESHPFAHHQHAAHCESGVMATLMKNSGLNISEPMAFGLSSALNFAYLPFIKVNGQPLIAYRMPPKFIIKKLSKRLGCKLKVEKYGNSEKGTLALDNYLREGKVVGLQTSVFWLPYFPQEMRFHFNAHNLLVYGKEGNDYFISDPVIEHPVSCDADSLRKARFAKGALAPKGTLYFLDSVAKDIDFNKVIKDAIKDTTRIIDSLPIPIAGIRGIRYLAKKIDKLSTDEKHAHANKLFLGHIVRMQEEIGTGGAGFRFMYASFLQESAQITGNEMLTQASEMMTDTGDQWREFAMNTVKYCKGRGKLQLSDLSESLRQVADSEQQVLDLLKDYSKQK